MKKLATSLLLGAMVFAFANVQARNVSEQEARQAAANYFSHNTDRQVKSADLDLVHQIDNTELNVAECFMFNIANDGWIIMSGSAASDPVIAFSEEGQLNETYSELPANMRWWIEGYAEMIGELQDIDAEEKIEDDPMWGRLTSGDIYGDPKVTSRILINTRWDQGDIRRPSYNLYCPRIGNFYCYTGCVATAMAQIIRYWGFPVQPTRTVRTYFRATGEYIALKLDTVQFDYTKMPTSIANAYGNITASDEEVHNVAMLGYACGMATQMDYDTSGSGTQSSLVVSAMKDNFGYVYGNQIARNGNADTSFIGRIRRNLQNQCPVYMSGRSATGGTHAAGHAWVCCGYRIDENNAAEEKKYYMNWGWGGSGNGWFNLVDNQMAMSLGYNFSREQGAIVHLYPRVADSTTVDFTGIPEIEDNVELPAAYPNPATLSVTLPYSVNSATEMTVYSIDGKLVATRSLKPGDGAVKLNVSNMPAGIYIYRVGGKSGKFMVE